MNGVIADEYKTTLLDLMDFTNFANNVYLILFETITTISHTDTFASITAHECSFSGYARVFMNGWAAATLTPDKHAIAASSVLATFTNTGGTATPTITGWALIDTSGSKLFQAGLYDTPFTIPPSQNYSTTPFLTMFGEIQSEP